MPVGKCFEAARCAVVAAVRVVAVVTAVKLINNLANNITV